ncbi:hypothetical protein PMAYCL1PPCAC_00995, partial [Pristionchus mayeri]
RKRTHCLHPRRVFCCAEFESHSESISRSGTSRLVLLRGIEVVEGEAIPERRVVEKGEGFAGNQWLLFKRR